MKSTNQTCLTSQNLLVKKFQVYYPAQNSYKPFLYVKFNKCEKNFFDNIINEIAANPKLDLELYQYFIDPFTGEYIDGLSRFLYLISGNMKKIEKIFQRYLLFK